MNPNNQSKKNNTQKSSRTTSRNTTYLRPINKPQNTLENLRLKEFTKTYDLSPSQLNFRKQIIKQTITIGIEKLELRNRTIQLAIRLFDFYCFKKIGLQQQPELASADPLNNLNTFNLRKNGTSKYEEIYPPCLNDFMYFMDRSLIKTQIYNIEVEILMTCDFGFTIATISQFYEELYNEPIPDWYIWCYTIAHSTTQDKAVTIRNIQNHKLLSTGYEQLSQLLATYGTTLKEKSVNYMKME